MANLTYQDVLFVQNGVTSPMLDLSKPGFAQARRVADFNGYAFQCVWQGNPSGTLQVQVSNASVLNDKLVEPANWVVNTALTLNLGSGTPLASSPALLEVTFGRAGWTSLLWTPSGSSSGNLTARFDGVRR